MMTVGVCAGAGAVGVSSLVGEEGGLDSKMPDSFNKSARLTPFAGLQLLLPAEDPCTLFCRLFCRLLYLLLWMELVVMREGCRDGAEEERSVEEFCDPKTFVLIIDWEDNRFDCWFGMDCVCRVTNMGPLGVWIWKTGDTPTGEGLLD